MELILTTCCYTFCDYFIDHRHVMESSVDSFLGVELSYWHKLGFCLH